KVKNKEIYMHVIKWFASIGLALALVAMPSQAQQIKSDNPFDLLEQVANKTFERIAEDRAKIDEDLDYLRTVVNDEMMPYVDWQFAANKTLGRYYKDTPEEQRREYQKVFRDYLIATYARAFLQYDESKHKVEFAPERGFDDESRVTVVRAQIVEEGGRPPIRLDFQIGRA